MRICYVGHAFHKKTKSNVFFIEILEKIGDVTIFYADPDAGPLHNDFIYRALVNHQFDIYVFWQTDWIAEHVIPLELKNVFLVPMYDAVHARPSTYWQRFDKHHVIAFCRQIYESVRIAGGRSSYFQYYIDPGDECVRTIDAHHREAFFWERRPASEINLDLVTAQARMLGIRKLHVHAVPDLAGEERAIQISSSSKLEIVYSTWFDDPADLARVAARPLFVFLPRSREGIGMSMIEAMARGQIVVGPDLPTTNEYVAHMVSGLLYHPAMPKLRADLPRLDVPEMTAMSRAARRKVVQGRKTWLADVDRLTSLLRGDDRRWPTGDYSSGFVARIRHAAHARRTADA